MGLTEERLIDGNPVRDPKLTSKTWSWFENDRAFRRDRFQTNWRFWKSIEGRVQVSINNSRLCQTDLKFSVLPPDPRVFVKHITNINNAMHINIVGNQCIAFCWQDQKFKLIHIIILNVPSNEVHVIWRMVNVVFSHWQLISWHFNC